LRGSFFYLAKNHRQDHEGHGQPEDEGQSKSMRPLKTKQEPETGEPQEEMAKV
jgi:hypothetical protein